MTGSERAVRAERAGCAERAGGTELTVEDTLFFARSDRFARTAARGPPTVYDTNLEMKESPVLLDGGESWEGVAMLCKLY